MLQTDKSTLRGTWRSSVVQGKYQIDVRTEDSRWTWNGSCYVHVRNNELVLSISRPWQLDCTVTLVRTMGDGDEDQ
jgi:hypothetical protein